MGHCLRLVTSTTTHTALTIPTTIRICVPCPATLSACSAEPSPSAGHISGPIQGCPPAIQSTDWFACCPLRLRRSGTIRTCNRPTVTDTPLGIPQTIRSVVLPGSSPSKGLPTKDSTPIRTAFCIEIMSVCLCFQPSPFTRGPAYGMYEYDPREPLTMDPRASDPYVDRYDVYGRLACTMRNDGSR